MKKIPAHKKKILSSFFKERKKNREQIFHTKKKTWSVFFFNAHITQIKKKLALPKLKI